MPDRQRKRFNNLRKWIVRILIIGLFSVITVFAIWRNNIRVATKRELAKIRAAGEPITLQELSMWPIVVDYRNNVAFIYTNAISHFHDQDLVTKPYLQLPRRLEKFSESEAGRAAKLIEINQELVEIVDRDTGQFDAHYPLDYSQGIYLHFPHLEKLKNLGRLFIIRATIDLGKNDTESAVKDLTRSMSIANSLSLEPMLISQLAKNTILRTNSRCAELLINQSLLSDSQLLRMQNLFVKAESHSSASSTLIGERCLYYDIFQKIIEDPGKIASETSSDEDSEHYKTIPKSKFIRTTGFLDRDCLFFLKAMAADIQTLRMPPPSSLQLESANSKFCEEAAGRWYLLSSLILPSYSRIAKSEATLQATLQTTAASIAVERWRLAHNNELPETLNELVPGFFTAVPNDPFDGNPLRFKKLAKGYVIYSIGPDLQDDGGKEQKSSKKGMQKNIEPCDITFTVER